MAYLYVFEQRWKFSLIFFFFNLCTKNLDFEDYGKKKKELEALKRSTVSFLELKYELNFFPHFDSWNFDRDSKPMSFY